MKSISLPWNRMSYHLSGFQKLHKKGNKMVSFSVCLVVPYHPYPHCHFLKQDKNRFNLLGMLVFKCSMDPICAIAVIQDLSFFATTGYPIWLWLSTRSFPILFFCPPSTYQPCSISQTEKLNQRLISQVADEPGTEPGRPYNQMGLWNSVVSLTASPSQRTACFARLMASHQRLWGTKSHKYTGCFVMT